MPGYISERERLHGKLNSHSLNEKVLFQVEDRERSKKIAASRVMEKRLNTEHVEAKIQMYDQDQMTMQTQKLMTQAGRQDNYEKVFHMFH